MTQPVYKFIANLGDVNPLDHGGFFVYEDTTGRYPPMAELYDNERLQVWHIELERMYNWHTILAPYDMAMQKKTLPRPLAGWEEWFSKHVKFVADRHGVPAGELRRKLCSTDILERARGYQMLAEECGLENFDPDGPLQLASRGEAALRYQQEVGKAGWVYCNRCDAWHSYDEMMATLGQVGPCASCLEEERQELETGLIPVQLTADQRIKQIMAELGYD